MNIGRIDRWALEGGARAAYRLLLRVDKRVLVSDFVGTDEPLLMVYAKGDRVRDIAAAIEPFLDRGSAGEEVTHA